MALSLDEVEARALARWQPAKPTYDAEAMPTWFHSGQAEAWECAAAVIAICAGWQSGKTVFLAPWLLREIQRCGPGDYGAFSSTYKLLARKFLPELKKTFGPFADFRAGDMQFVFTEAGEIALFGKRQETPTVIQLGYAENPDSLESATMKAVIWDEPGQRLVPEQSFRTLESRLMVNRGRMALASRPYEFNWYQTLVAKADGEKVKAVNFASWHNPVNPPRSDEYWSGLRGLPAWRFAMLYEGLFTRPAGQIYDCFSDENIIEETGDKPWTIPEGWDVYAGQDFGDRNMAGVFIARGPDGQLVCFASYHKGHVTVKEHIANLRRKATQPTAGIAGGAPSEDDWRRDFTVAGWPIVKPPIRDVEVGISRVYRLIADGRLRFTRLGAHAVIDEINRYAREVNDAGEPIDKIADKETFHRLDALRYVCSTFFTYAESSRTPIARGKLIHV